MRAFREGVSMCRSCPDTASAPSPSTRRRTRTHRPVVRRTGERRRQHPALGRTSSRSASAACRARCSPRSSATVGSTCSASRSSASRPDSAAASCATCCSTRSRAALLSNWYLPVATASALIGMLLQRIFAPHPAADHRARRAHHRAVRRDRHHRRLSRPGFPAIPAVFVGVDRRRSADRSCATCCSACRSP